MTIFSSPLPGFAFCTNDLNNSVNGRSILALASIGAGGVAPFGVPPGTIPGVSGIATNVRADGLAFGDGGPNAPAPVPPASVEVVSQHANWLECVGGGAAGSGATPDTGAPVLTGVSVPIVSIPNYGNANIASTIA
jgi:hypothetical protein